MPPGGRPNEQKTAQTFIITYRQEIDDVLPEHLWKQAQEVV